jgi:two-component sensor histidine kinase/CheY-like chemotaxis protein
MLLNIEKRAAISRAVTTRTEDCSQRENIEHLFSDCVRRIETLSALIGILHDPTMRGGDCVDMSFLLKKVARMVSKIYGLRKIAITINCVAEAKLRLEDARICGLIASELIANSLEHAYPKRQVGHIGLAFSEVADGVCELIVTDDGCGYNVANRRGGSCTGLTLVSAFAEDLGGRAIFESTADEGSRSTIRFQPGRPKRSKYWRRRRVDLINVLVVEDDTIKFYDCVGILQSCGCVVIARALTKADAMYKVKSHAADLLIVDVRLGEGKDEQYAGVDFVEDLRAAGMETPVIFLTAFEDAETQRRFVNIRFAESVIRSGDDYARNLMHHVRLSIMRKEKKRRLFICYQASDSRFKKEVRKQLNPATRSIKGFEVWDDEAMQSTPNWKEEIIRSIDSSFGALILIGPGFLESKFIAEVEVPRLLKRRNSGQMKLWIVQTSASTDLREENRFGGTYKHPISDLRMQDRQKFWTKLAEDIELYAKSLDESM